MLMNIPIRLEENLHADLAGEVGLHSRNELTVTSVNGTLHAQRETPTSLDFFDCVFNFSISTRWVRWDYIPRGWSEGCGLTVKTRTSFVVVNSDLRSSMT